KQALSRDGRALRQPLRMLKNLFGQALHGHSPVRNIRDFLTVFNRSLWRTGLDERGALIEEAVEEVLAGRNGAGPGRKDQRFHDLSNQRTGHHPFLRRNGGHGAAVHRAFLRGGSRWAKAFAAAVSAGSRTD